METNINFRDNQIENLNEINKIDNLNSSSEIVPEVISENLRYTYPPDSEGNIKLAIDGVNITINKGEFVVVLGHNGSGKSTFAKHINALLIPTEGKISVSGYDTSKEENIWNVRSKAGMVFQNPDNQIVATIVEEDVAFGPENLGRKEVINTIMDLNKNNGITIVYITHFMEEAVAADKIYVMDSGKVIVEGKPREVFQNVEIMKNLGLDVPQMTELAYELNKSGVNIKSDILTIDEMVRELCQLK